MKNVVIKFVALGVAAVLAVGYMFFTFTVDVTEQVVVTRLGKPVRTVLDPGLHFKLPVVDNTHYFSKKLLVYDAEPSEMITKDQKTLVVDNYCKWYISDPLVFYQSSRDVATAYRTLDSIIYSEMKTEIGRHDLIEVIDENRVIVMDNANKQAREKAESLGIHIADIKIKRADLPLENERAVFERMKTERVKEATQYRSEGKEEAQKIRAEADKSKAVILAEAYRSVKEIEGRADSGVIKISADAYSKDPKLFEFLRTLDVYRESLGENANYFMTTDSDIFNLFRDANVK